VPVKRVFYHDIRVRVREIEGATPPRLSIRHNVHVSQLSNKTPANHKRRRQTDAQILHSVFDCYTVSCRCYIYRT